MLKIMRIPAASSTRPKKMLRDLVLRRFISEAPTIDPITPPTPTSTPSPRFTSPEMAKVTAPATAIGKMLASDVAWAR